jgi:hypothetical protein
MYRLKFIINSGEATPGGVLAPVLAPFGLDLLQISKELNEKTLNVFIKGVPVSVKIFIYDNKQYKILVGKPFLKFYLSSILEVGSTITMLNFYNLVILYSLHYNKNYKRTAAIFFGSLRSFSFKIKISV